MHLSHIDIVSIPVSDQDAARTFYRDVLGFQVLRDDPFGDGRWLQLALPNARTSITLVTWFEDMPAGSVRGLVLATDDLDADHERLVRQGVGMSDISTAPWGRFATFADPDGNGWVLQAAPSAG